jgi:hypothetical protein
MAGHRQRSLMGLLGLAFAAGFGACFIEPALPGNFRFECASDVECMTGEVCANGLCQQPCGGEMDQDCGSSGICLNGYCSGLCTITDDRCSDPQVCTSLAPPEESSAEFPAVCIVPCSDDDNPCAEGQLCYADLGLCVTSCMTSDECGDGEECFFGVCFPSF